MFKSKITISLFIVFCITFLSTCIAFAEVKESDISQYHQQVDKYIFEDHKDEIAKQGITVVYTGEVNGTIEIGINPYNEENAQYFLDAFDKNVKVVKADPVSTLANETSVQPIEGQMYKNGLKAAEPGSDKDAVEPEDGNLYMTVSATTDPDSPTSNQGENVVKDVAVKASDNNAESSDKSAVNKANMETLIVIIAFVAIVGGAYLVRRKQLQK